MRAPTLFISHGSPMLAIEPSPARDFLIQYGKSLPRPDAIVIASAHFETEIPAVVTDAQPDMIYDFGGFPDALFQIVYPAPGQPEVAMKVAHMIHDTGLQTGVVSHRGFDHGTWVPLSLMFPDADIPVVQIAVQPHLGAAHHVALGRALTSLKEQNIMVIGSGSATHNLREFYAHRHMKPGEAPEWVIAFDDWVRERVQAGNTAELIDYRKLAPHAVRNHPTEEHFVPLHVAVGAAGEGAKGELLHSSYANGVLSMDAYIFH
jgi:4,5-DOPA dioxygenase extradiol